MTDNAGASAPALEDTMAKNTKNNDADTTQDESRELIAITKGDETIEVAASQVAQHESLGWVVA
jgi:hypothetical protein